MIARQVMRLAATAHSPATLAEAESGWPIPAAHRCGAPARVPMPTAWEQADGFRVDCATACAHCVITGAASATFTQFPTTNWNPSPHKSGPQLSVVHTPLSDASDERLGTFMGQNGTNAHSEIVTQRP